MGFISADRDQMSLFGYRLDDFVSADAKCRFVVDVVRELDLSEVYADYSSQGGDAYDPAILLATWFFAYSEGVSSTRRLETLCSRDMHYIYVSANLRVDHTTLSRFRQRHGARLAEYFVQIIRLAAKRKVSDFRSIMTDGSKMQAGCSRRKNRGAKDLERELAKVTEEIADYFRRSELLDEEDAKEHDLGEVRQKIERLKELERTLRERQGQLGTRKKTLQKKDRTKHKINLVEPEARNMNQVNGQLAAPAYNAQLSVDAETQLIVAAEVTDSPNDRNQFCRQHAQVEKNLGSDANRQYTADSGYHSLEQLEYVEQEKIDAVIADPRPETRAMSESEQKTPEPEGAFTRSNFRYHKEVDEYECPSGVRLTYWHTENKRGRRLRHYRGGSCSTCALRTRCMKGDNPDSNRVITRDESEHLAEAMCRKASSPEGRHRLKRRSMSVEPAIGNVKSNMGFRRFHLRGKAKAAAEFILMCIGHNLGKLHALMGDFRRSPAETPNARNTIISHAGRQLGEFINRLWHHEKVPVYCAA